MVGVCNGGVQTIVYWTYALAFIYGAWRISVGAMDGGAVLNVFVAALIGGFSAGQAAPVLANFARGRVAGYKLFKVSYQFRWLSFRWLSLSPILHAPPFL